MGRVFGLQGNGSDGSKDLEVEEEVDDEEAMIAASVYEMKILFEF